MAASDAAGAAAAPGRSSASSPPMPRACARCRSKRAGTRWRPTGASCWAWGRASASGARTANGSPARWRCRSGPTISWLSMVLVTKLERGQGPRHAPAVALHRRGRGQRRHRRPRRHGARPADLSAARVPRRLSALALARAAGVSASAVRPPGGIVVRAARRGRPAAHLRLRSPAQRIRPRPPFSAHLLSRAPALARVAVRADGTFAGYALGRDGYRALHVGPVVAEDEGVGLALLSSALAGNRSAADRRHSGPPRRHPPLAGRAGRFRAAQLHAHAAGAATRGSTRGRKSSPSPGRNSLERRGACRSRSGPYCRSVRVQFRNHSDGLDSCRCRRRHWRLWAALGAAPYAAGYRVRALVRAPMSAAICKASGAEVHAADIFDGTSLRAGLKGCDVAINLATSLPSPAKSGGDFDLNDRVRREGVPIFLEACASAGVHRVIQQSIAMVHSGGGNAWADEDAIFPLPQGFDCAPRDHDRARNGSRRCGKPISTGLSCAVRCSKGPAPDSTTTGSRAPAPASCGCRERARTT